MKSLIMDMKFVCFGSTSNTPLLLLEVMAETLPLKITPS